MTEGTHPITPGAVMVRRADRGGGDRKLRPSSAAQGGRITCLRRLHLNRRIGGVQATDLRRIRLGVMAVIGLADLLLDR